MGPFVKAIKRCINDASNSDGYCCYLGADRQFCMRKDAYIDFRRMFRCEHARSSFCARHFQLSQDPSIVLMFQSLWSTRIVCQGPHGYVSGRFYCGELDENDETVVYFDDVVWC